MIFFAHVTRAVKDNLGHSPIESCRELEGFRSTDWLGQLAVDKFYLGSTIGPV
jgi:hypothetical protein